MGTTSRTPTCVAGRVLAVGFTFGRESFGTILPHPDSGVVQAERDAVAGVLSEFEGWVAGCLLDLLDDPPAKPPRGQCAGYEGSAAYAVALRGDSRCATYEITCSSSVTLRAARHRAECGENAGSLYAA